MRLATGLLVGAALFAISCDSPPVGEPAAGATRDEGATARASATAASPDPLRDRLLQVTDLPAGWQAGPVTPGSVSAGCDDAALWTDPRRQGTSRLAQEVTSAGVQFSGPAGASVTHRVIELSPLAPAYRMHLTDYLSTCVLSAAPGGTIEPISSLGNPGESAAYTHTARLLTASGTVAGEFFVIARDRRVAFLYYASGPASSGTVTPSTSLAQQLATIAEARLP